MSNPGNVFSEVISQGRDKRTGGKLQDSRMKMEDKGFKMSRRYRKYTTRALLMRKNCYICARI